jgi:hypothetical protein
MATPAVSRAFVWRAGISWKKHVLRLMSSAARGTDVITRSKTPTGDATMTTTNQNEYLPCETPVLNTNEGERGWILNGYAADETGWCEYEVSTQYGIERWKRSVFVLMTEIAVDA